MLAVVCSRMSCCLPLAVSCAIFQHYLTTYQIDISAKEEETPKTKPKKKDSYFQAYQVVVSIQPLLSCCTYSLPLLFLNPYSLSALEKRPIYIYIYVREGVSQSISAGTREGPGNEASYKVRCFS